MSNATPAQSLRAALKAAGYNARRVSVRHAHSTLRVTVRDATAALSAVKAIADEYRDVRYCQGSGEILCGGNTFVDVAYEAGLVAPIAAVIAVLLDLAGDGETVALAGGFQAAKLSRARGATYPDEVCIWGPGFEFGNGRACGVAFAATRIAIAYLDTRAVATTARPAQVAA